MAANRSAALRRTSPFGALVAFEIGAVVVLHRLGDLPWLRITFGDLGPWLQATAPEDAIAAVARVIALAAAWWLLAGTTLYVLAQLSRVPGAIHATGWVTLPAVRRVADQALTLATSLVSGGANAALAGPAALGPTGAGPMVTLRDRAGQRAETPPLGHQPHPAGSPRVGHEPGLAGPGRWGTAAAYDPRLAGPPARGHADHQEAEPPP
jgi:hypothetical protein